MRKVLIVSTLLAALGAGVAWQLWAARAQPREIVLEARGMAFFLAGDDTPNPTLRLERGEVVLLTLVNRDPGMRHDLAVGRLGVATGVLPGDGSRETVRLKAPRQPGRLVYLCRLHVQTMTGFLEVG